jgi:hypothetical protein
MTAENMVKHRTNSNIEFWNMLKVGYDNFEVTKRPPEVNVCEKKYVFNQSATGAFNPGGKCPEMSTPPALTAALTSYAKTYDVAYAKALKTFDGMAWYDPSEAERKAVVAKLRKGHDIAYAPTGTSLQAGRMVKIADLEGMMANKTATAVATNAAPASTPGARPVASAPGATHTPVPEAVKTTAVAVAEPAAVPVPTPSPLTAFAPAEQQEPVEVASKRPFWKFWAKD